VVDRHNDKYEREFFEKVIKQVSVPFAFLLLLIDLISLVEFRETILDKEPINIHQIIKNRLSLPGGNENQNNYE
jgi:hypothetical protein